ncbi:MAG: hypothetical protein P9L94_11965 [Candidatus Hinthialibacter antarcticus]|nr:hypothetical protein [Candidatus Hinthialibacter antarcticus]
MSERANHSRENWQFSPRLAQKILLGFGGGFALLLAGLMIASSHLRYAYGDAEYLTALFARGFFHPGDDLNPLVPYSQIHFPAAIVIWLSLRLGPLGGLLLWAAQSLVAFMLIQRIYQLAQRLTSQAQASAVLGVALVHPGVWAAMLYAPTQAATAWLALEAMRRVMDAPVKRNQAAAMFALLVLSFCGGNGFFWALAISAFGGFICFHAKRYASGGMLLAALAPALSMYCVLSAAWGTVGGPGLLNLPRLWNTVGWTPLMNGLWTQNAQAALVWLGQGALLLPPAMIAFGVLALLGVSTARGAAVFFCRFVLIACIAHLCVGAFSPLGDYQTFALVSQLSLLLLAVMGLGWLAQQFHADWLLPAGVAVFALTLLVSVFFELQPKWDRARFRQSLIEATRSVLDERGGGGMMQFSPALFAHLPADVEVAPMGMHWRVRYQENSVRMAPPTIEAALRVPCQWLGFYQPFDASQTGMLDSAQGPLLDSVRENYTTERSGALELWLRSPTRSIASSLDAAGQQTTDEKEYFSNGGETALQSLGEPVGFVWDFEHGFSRTRQVGAAFGLEPDVSQSAVGFASAGPGGGGAGRMMGSIASEPFVIEGDELRFFADIPKSSTQTFFALAVYDEEPWGNAAKIQTAKHLYDRAPGEVLMGGAFVYIQPAQLSYDDDSVSGWRVVRTLQNFSKPGWNEFRWSIGAWAGRQAIWLAADRDPNAEFRIDHIQQWKRAPGRYWNFETGDYAGWQVEGEAFGDAPAIASLGAQTTVSGFEGNYFVNSFHQGSDAAQGRLISEPFLIEHNKLSFSVGGGDDLQRTFIGLDIGGEFALRASGERDETLRPLVWDLTPWLGQSARIIIEDKSSGAWGHVLVDDIQMTNTQ